MAPLQQLLFTNPPPVLVLEEAAVAALVFAIVFRRLLRRLIIGVMVVAVIGLVAVVAVNVTRQQPDCHRQAALASQALAAETLALRHSLSKTQVKDRNIAGYSSCIDGIFSQGLAVSGEKSPPGTISLTTHPVFKYKKVRGFLRSRDAEAKLLEHLHATTQKPSRGVVYLFSELPFCTSCLDPVPDPDPAVVAQFQRARPAVTVIPLPEHPGNRR